MLLTQTHRSASTIVSHWFGPLVRNAGWRESGASVGPSPLYFRVRGFKGQSAPLLQYKGCYCAHSSPDVGISALARKRRANLFCRRKHHTIFLIEVMWGSDSTSRLGNTRLLYSRTRRLQPIALQSSSGRSHVR
jgi:hypothetical protein